MRPFRRRRRSRAESISLEEWREEHRTPLQAKGLSVLLTEANRSEGELTGRALIFQGLAKQGHVIQWSNGFVEVLVFRTETKEILLQGTAPPEEGEPTPDLLESVVELLLA